MVLTPALAAANGASGANDVSKGIATLAGADAARYRTTILWGYRQHVRRCHCSGPSLTRISVLFSHGIVAAPPTLGSPWPCTWARRPGSPSPRIRGRQGNLDQCPAKLRPSITQYNQMLSTCSAAKTTATAMASFVDSHCRSHNKRSQLTKLELSEALSFSAAPLPHAVLHSMSGPSTNSAEAARWTARVTAPRVIFKWEAFQTTLPERNTSTWGDS